MRYQRFKASRPDLNGAQADQTQTSGTPNSGAHDNSAGGAEGTAGKGKAKPKAAKGRSDSIARLAALLTLRVGKTGAKAEVGDADEDGVEASPVIPVKTTKKRKIEAESE